MEEIKKLNDILKYLKIGQITDYNQMVIDFNRIDNENVLKDLYEVFSNELLRLENKNE